MPLPTGIEQWKINQPPLWNLAFKAYDSLMGRKGCKLYKSALSFPCPGNDTGCMLGYLFETFCPHLLES